MAFRVWGHRTSTREFDFPPGYLPYTLIPPTLPFLCNGPFNELKEKKSYFEYVEIKKSYLYNQTATFHLCFFNIMLIS